MSLQHPSWRRNDRKLDLERIARVINSVEPDLVWLQEVDQVVPRSKNVDQVEELSDLIGLQSSFSQEHRAEWRKLRECELFSLVPREWASTELPNPDNGEARRELKLGIQPSHRFLHLVPQHALRSSPERSHASRIGKSHRRLRQRTWRRADESSSGDFNATPESETIKELEKT